MKGVKPMSIVSTTLSFWFRTTDPRLLELTYEIEKLLSSILVETVKKTALPCNGQALRFDVRVIGSKVIDETKMVRRKANRGLPAVYQGLEDEINSVDIQLMVELSPLIIRHEEVVGRPNATP
jgi:hypothetical protein